ncbi:MAG: hypothetical protein SNF33_00490 [Candidatus Algichlamydia australiensis]|nr:hypothetical protein [Chlamydiales bacterium]
MRKMIVPLALLACSLFAKANSSYEKAQSLIHQGDNWWRWSNEREAERCYTKVINETDCPNLLEAATLRRGLLYAELGEESLAIADFSRSFHSSEFNIFTDLMDTSSLNHVVEASISDGMQNSLPSMKPLIFAAAIEHRNNSLKHPSKGEVGGAWDFLYDGDSLASFHEIPPKISQCIKEIEKECLRFFERAREALLKGEVNEAANCIQEAIRRKFLSTEQLVHQKTIEKNAKPTTRKPAPPPKTVPVVQPRPVPRPAPAPVALPAEVPPEKEPVAVETNRDIKEQRGRRGRRRGNIRAGAATGNEQEVPAKGRRVRGRRGRRGRASVAQNDAQESPAKGRRVRGRRGKQSRASVAPNDTQESSAKNRRARGRRGRQGRTAVAQSDAKQVPAKGRRGQGRRGRRG